MQKQFRYYLGAHGGKSLVWHAYDLLFAYFLTQYLHLPPQTMGVVAMALMLFSAIADPVAGWWIDRGPDTLRRLAGLQVWGALLSAIAFLVLFSVPRPASPLLHAVVVGLAFQVCYKLYDVPQNALTSVLTRDSREVLRLSTGRYFLSGSARIVVACIAYLLIGKGAQSRSDWSMTLFVALLCVPALASAWLLAQVARQTTGHAGEASKAVAGTAPPGLLARIPRGMALLLFAGFVNAGMVSVMSRILPYLGEQSGALIAFSVGTLALLPLFQFVAVRFGEHQAFMLAALLTGVACVGLAWSFHLSGINGSVGLDAFAFLYGGGAFGCTMLLWGTAANLIHRHNARTGLRLDTLSYGIFTFASKLGIALSMVALGHALGPSVPLPHDADYGDALNKAAVFGMTGAVIGAATIYRTMRALSQTAVPSKMGPR